MKQPAQKTKQVPKNKTKKKREPILLNTKKIDKIALLIFALFSFSFLAIYYADVLKLAEGYSLFLYDYTQMTYINQSNWGIPFYIGRFLLQFHHYPLLGATITTTILCASSYLLYTALKPIPSIKFIALIIPATFFAILVYCGFGLFHLMEPSTPFVYLAAIFTLSGITTILSYAITKTLKQTKKQLIDDRKTIIQYALTATIMTIIATYAIIYPRIDNDIITHSKMMTAVLDNKWDKVETNADKIDHHTRSTAAFNAIALAHKGQLGNKLFKKSYRYPIQITKTAGTEFHETMMYYSLCTYYAGLTHSAYYKAMEFATLNGFSPFILKILTKCAILHGENKLADKYLYILSKTTFHKDFVEKYQPYTKNPELIQKNPEFNRILGLTPIQPLPFIQYYRDPIFIGYNILLTEGRSIEALHLSLVSCLYGKQSNNFIERAQALDKKTILPTHYQEAIYLFSLLKNKPQFAEQFNINKLVKQKTLEFLKDYEKLKHNKFEAREKLKKYVGIYAYYYLLENLPEESKKEKELYKKGVN